MNNDHTHRQGGQGDPGRSRGASSSRWRVSLADAGRRAVGARPPDIFRAGAVVALSLGGAPLVTSSCQIFCFLGVSARALTDAGMPVGPGIPVPLAWRLGLAVHLGANSGMVKPPAGGWWFLSTARVAHIPHENAGTARRRDSRLSGKAPLHARQGRHLMSLWRPGFLVRRARVAQMRHAWRRPAVAAALDALFAVS